MSPRRDWQHEAERDLGVRDPRGRLEEMCDMSEMDQF
jgi:hypothetical protein